MPRQAPTPDLPATLAEIDATNGFGPCKFGTPVGNLPSSLTNLRVIKGKNLTAPAEAISIGGFQLQGFLFGAYNGRLASIQSGPTKDENAEQMLQILQARNVPSKKLAIITLYGRVK